MVYTQQSVEASFAAPCDDLLQPADVLLARSTHSGFSPDIAISVQNLTKVYKLYHTPIDRLKESLHPLRRKYHHDFHALHNLSFEVRKGETVGILGKNGSGKSTLLKILTSVLTPTSGTVSVNGRVSALLELGAGFNPELTGIENVYFNGTLMGYSHKEMDARIDNILAFADIGEFVNQPVKIYSSGMFVRLAFATMVNIEPEILIVDEALSVGDLRFQRKCKVKINEFKERGTTILLVSHSMAEISTICTSSIYLRDGQIAFHGNTEGAINAYTYDQSKEDQLKVDFRTSGNKESDCLPTEYGGDKGGTGDIIISNIHCYQKGKSKQIPEIGFGENIMVEFHYKAFNRIERPFFRVNISVPEYSFFANFDSHDYGHRITSIEDGGDVVLEIINQRLYPRAYTVNVAVVTENINCHLFFWNKAAGFVIRAKGVRAMHYPTALIALDAKMTHKKSQDNHYSVSVDETGEKNY